MTTSLSRNYTFKEYIFPMDMAIAIIDNDFSKLEPEDQKKLKEVLKDINGTLIKSEHLECDSYMTLTFSLN